MEFEGRRRWLGLLAATLALPGCVSMGPRPEPRQALPADWDNRARGRAGRRPPPRWWTAFEDAGAGCAGRTRAGGQPDAGTGGATARGARPCRVPARPRPCRRSAHGAAQRQHRLFGPHGANELSGAEAGQGGITAGAGRTVHRLLPGRFRRPPGNPTCSGGRIAAATGRGARERRRRRSRLARGPKSWPPRPCARYIERSAAAPSGAVRPAGRPAPSARPCRSADAGIASDFGTAPACWAETAAQLPLSAHWRGSTRSVRRCLPERARSRRAAGVRRPAPAARRADRAPAGRYRARPAGHPSRGTAGAAGRGRTAGVDRRAIPAPDPVR